ncbi:MAG: 1-acyl-sn-glycerol-3-phosphate acyltransferase [Acidobacteria bacterium]|nr:1-acyl-sn-glycerol-3-phosphate acyltransferase [Acidobacteriota bacterium]
MRTAINAVRTIFGLAFVVVPFTAVACVYLMVATRFGSAARQTDFWGRYWGRVTIFCSGAKVAIEGLENVDRRRSYVIVSNHLSNLDAPYHFGTMPVGVRFLAKKELYKIPLFGSTLRAVGMVETDRRDHSAEAHQRINERVAYVISIGRSVMIYPEGTRSADAELHAFKKGAFRIAIQNQMPILPVATAGTNGVWPHGEKWWRGGQTRMVFHPPIETTGLDDSAIDPLIEQVRGIIGSTYERIRHQV